MSNHILIISENKEAEEMLKTTRRLVGRIKGMRALMLRPGKSLESMEKKVGRVVSDLDPEDSLLILTDFYGSTQCNVCMKHLQKGRVEIMTGFNLPMLLKLIKAKEEMTLSQLIPFIEQYGKDHIRYFDQHNKNWTT